MANNESANDTVDVAVVSLLGEGACRYDDNSCSSMEQTPPVVEKTPPEPGKTPSTFIRVADLAATVDGGIGENSAS